MHEKNIVGYTDPLSVAPGETVRFMVSCEAGVKRYRAGLVRLISGDDQPGGPGMRCAVIESAIDGDYEARRQPVHPGSFALVDDAPAFERLTSVHLQAVIMPTLVDRPGSTLMSRLDEHAGAGFALQLDADGALAFRAGDGKGGCHSLSTGVALDAHHWYLVAAGYDAATGTLHVSQRPLGRALPTLVPAHAVAETGAAVLTCRAPLLLGARFAGEVRGRPVASAHWNGRIERPLLACRTLAEEEMEQCRRGALPAGVAGDVICCHDFALAPRGDAVRDISANRLDGRLWGQPIRAVPSSDWDGSEMNPAHRPEHYAAVHFLEDSLDDCHWQADFELELPADLRSGLYAAHLRGDDGSHDYLPFFVRPPRGTASAPLALLVPTASYFAYANVRTAWDDEIDEMLMNRLTVLGAEDLHLMRHPELGHSVYDLHNDGSGVCYSSRHRPILNMRPDHPSLWQMSADMHLVAWLEHEGIAYDVITDEDLHAEGISLLANYRCVMTGSHPEYYSTPMWDALDDWLQQGGRLMYMGGNGFYWRVAFHPDRPGIMEMRRAEDGSRAWIARPGEYHLGFSGELGGLWWRCGRPPQGLVGVGFTAQGFDHSSYYRRRPGAEDARAAWIFEGVAGETFGDYGLYGGGAAGVELDCADAALGTPPHALVLASSENHTDSYLHVNEMIGHLYAAIGGTENPKVRADMVFFETGNGGAVWSSGSIAWVSALPCAQFDNDVARITGNVVRRFCAAEPLPAPPV